MTQKILYLIVVFSITTTFQNIFAQIQDDNIQITYKENPDNSVDFLYTKRMPGSYYVIVNFNTMSNCSQFDYKGVIKGRTGKLLKLTPLDNKLPIGFSYGFSYVRGTPNPRVNKDFNYVLPFKKGKTIEITESINLEEQFFEDSEKGKDWKSFIVNRNTADTVHSMRKGVVIEVEDEFDENNSSREYLYTSQMNAIYIEHEDGTVARYIGFKKGSIFVKLGQTVYPHTKLGVLSRFSDATYRLYFDVSYLGEIGSDIYSGATKYISPYFYTSNGTVKLKHATTYTANINEAIFTKEFTRRENRKYKKKPEAFK